jgi:hypothetical protein
MIDERCGLPQPIGGEIVDAQQLEMGMANPRAGFARVISELVADIVERIVYR